MSFWIFEFSNFEISKLLISHKSCGSAEVFGAGHQSLRKRTTVVAHTGTTYIASRLCLCSIDGSGGTTVVYEWRTSGVIRWSPPTCTACRIQWNSHFYNCYCPSCSSAFALNFECYLLHMASPPLHLVLCCLPCYGHAKPLVIFAEHLADAGHEVIAVLAILTQEGSTIILLLCIKLSLLVRGLYCTSSVF